MRFPCARNKVAALGFRKQGAATWPDRITALLGLWRHSIAVAIIIIVEVHVCNVSATLKNKY